MLLAVSWYMRPIDRIYSKHGCFLLLSFLFSLLSPGKIQQKKMAASQGPRRQAACMHGLYLGHTYYVVPRS